MRYYGIQNSRDFQLSFALRDTGKSVEACMMDFRGPRPRVVVLSRHEYMIGRQGMYADYSGQMWADGQARTRLAEHLARYNATGQTHLEAA
jgi:hypothetical protein